MCIRDRCVLVDVKTFACASDMIREIGFSALVPSARNARDTLLTYAKFYSTYGKRTNHEQADMWDRRVRSGAYDFVAWRDVQDGPGLAELQNLFRRFPAVSDEAEAMHKQMRRVFAHSTGMGKDAFVGDRASQWVGAGVLTRFASGDKVFLPNWDLLRDQAIKERPQQTRELVCFFCCR